MFKVFSKLFKTFILPLTGILLPTLRQMCSMQEMAVDFFSSQRDNVRKYRSYFGFEEPRCTVYEQSRELKFGTPTKPESSMSGETLGLHGRVYFYCFAILSVERDCSVGETPLTKEETELCQAVTKKFGESFELIFKFDQEMDASLMNLCEEATRNGENDTLEGVMSELLNKNLLKMNEHGERVKALSFELVPYLAHL
jgi:hypothetical protein